MKITLFKFLILQFQTLKFTFIKIITAMLLSNELNLDHTKSDCLILPLLQYKANSRAESWKSLLSQLLKAWNRCILPGMPNHLFCISLNSLDIEKCLILTLDFRVDIDKMIDFLEITEPAKLQEFYHN